jgi:hypothetical protein
VNSIIATSRTTPGILVLPLYQTRSTHDAVGHNRAR